ncbi:cytochrome c [Rhodobacteraceae bacterium M385]|nr:cytochrome c [Rhodobacteraceae bacterium M385]
MGRVLRISAALVVLGLGVAWALTRPTYITQTDVAGLAPGDPVAGEAVFWAAGCASCHSREDASAEERLVLAGGQEFPSDFGTFRAPNISTDATHGIGGWSLPQFLTALQNGISPDGQHYYPAFPYTAYRLADQQDLADLFAFMQTLPASDTPSLPHDVGFPFNIRRAVGLWNVLNLHDTYAVTADLPATAARGRYLAEALAHCGECHTPRNGIGALDRSAWLTGAPDPSGRGTIPALTPAELSWSADEIAAYLADGFTPEFDSAGGHMRSVILNLAQISAEDRAAIAAYLLALPEADQPTP